MSFRRDLARYVKYTLTKHTSMREIHSVENKYIYIIHFASIYNFTTKARGIDAYAGVPLRCSLYEPTFELFY